MTIRPTGETRTWTPKELLAIREADATMLRQKKNLQLKYEVLLSGMIPFHVDEDGGVVTGRWQTSRAQVVSLEVTEDE
jgi:hypothetical protein